MKTQHVLGIAAIILVVAASIYLLTNRGYGKVSRETYDVATAIYSACLSKSEPRIEKIEQMMLERDETVEDPMTDQERRWLDSIIQKARNGYWESAAKDARQIMEDQTNR